MSGTPGAVPAVTFTTYDLMLAPYTTSSATLSPRVLIAGIAPSLGWLRLANGFLSGIYLSRTTNPVQSGALVVNTSTGQAFRAELPGQYSFGYGLFTSATELWGAIGSGPMINFETYIRIPLGSLTKTQDGFPD